MKKILVVVLFLLLLSFSLRNVYAQFDTDIAGYGFTTGIAVKEIPAGQSVQVSNHNLKVDISQGTFSFPITFEILQGQNSYFQSETPTGRIIITNFAFRIRNHTTNMLVGDFKHPVLVTVILPDDVSGVEIWKAELTHPPQIVSSKNRSEVGDKTVLLEVDSATTGWIITGSTGDISANEENRETGTSENNFSENFDISNEEINPNTSSLVLPVLIIIVVGSVLIFLIRK